MHTHSYTENTYVHAYMYTQMHQLTPSLPHTLTHTDHDDPPDEKQNEDDLLKPTDNSPDHDQTKSIPKYLTLMRDPDTKQFAVSTDSSPSPDYSRPVVPPHRQRWVWSCRVMYHNVIAVSF